MSSPTVVFDLDGTLIDTAPDLIDSINHTIMAAGLEPVDATMLRSQVGHGGRVMIERCFAARQKTLAEGQLASLLATFIAHYESGMPGRSIPYPGVLDTLDRFAAAGYRLAVCTNKLESLALRLMTGLDLIRRFDAICGADTFDFRKPDPRHLTETIARAGGDPARALMVGDSRTDIDTAKNAGVPVVAVDFGYTDRHVREFRPSMVISHFDELTLEQAERLLRAAA